MFQSYITSRRFTTTGGIDKCMEMSEHVENSRDFHNWVAGKPCEYFSQWKEYIQSYHDEKGIPWTRPIAVPSPYGFMGYDLVKPELKSNPVTFGRPVVTLDDFNLSDFEDLSSEEEDSDLDVEVDEYAMPKCGELIVANGTIYEVYHGTTMLREGGCVFPKICMVKLAGDEYLTINDKDIDWESTEKLNAGIDERVIDSAALPEGWTLEDIPKGFSVSIPEDEIVFGEEILDLPEVKPCKCGSTLHKRTNHKTCPLNKKNLLVNEFEEVEEKASRFEEWLARKERCFDCNGNQL
jgi:hypothetical protein